MHDLPPWVTDYDVGSEEIPEFHDNSDDLVEQKRDYEDWQKPTLTSVFNNLAVIAPELSLEKRIQILELFKDYLDFYFK